MKWTLYTGLLIFLLFASSCSRKIIVPPTAENLIVFPSPPDKPKIQFLTYINSSVEIEKPASWAKRFFVGTKAPKHIFRPYGIASKGNKIFICDPQIKGLEIIDLKERTFKYFLPKGIGELRMPLNCFIDDENNLYVADSYRKQIVVFDKDLKYLNAFNSSGDFKPIDVFVDSSRIYVANLEGRSFDVFEKGSFNYLDSYPKLEKGDDGYLYKPTSVYVENDKVYVNDFGEVKIKVYDKNGKFIRSIGSYGRGMGQLARPKEISFDRNGILYVVDAAFENVQLFNNEGRLLTYMGRPGNMSLPAGIGFSYDNLDVFKDYVYKDFDLKFLIFVSNQFGSNKIGVYGFVEEKSQN